MVSPVIKIIVLALVFGLGLFAGRIWQVNDLCYQHPEEMDQMSPQLCFFD